MDNGKKFPNAGDILHIIQIVIVFIGIGALYQKIESGLDEVRLHTLQLHRLEMYISSHDPDYWKYSDGNNSNSNR